MTLQLPLDLDRDRPLLNLLPQHGEAFYHGPIFSSQQSDALLSSLLQEVAWKHDECVMFGKRIVTARQVAWFGDQDYGYRYSGTTHTATQWNQQLREIKETVEALTGKSYNSCLLNLYHDGSQGMGWHQDNEKELGEKPHIASVSFGAERRFDFRLKESGEKVFVHLEHGSLLVMQGTTQTYWQHQMPKTQKVTTPRLNLTFRQFLAESNPE